MKRVHTGDWHIKIPEKHEKWYINRLVRFFKTILDEDGDELLITGDIFDKVPSALEIGLFIAFIQDVKCPIYIVAGNHDRTKKTGTKRADYLGNILHFCDFPNVTWTTEDILESGEYVMVPNYYIRQKKEIPVNKDKILLSHIRHEIKYAKAEYDLELLKGFKQVLLSDIHTTIQYAGNIFYSTSPYRTTKQTVKDVKDVDNDNFGYNRVFNNRLEHRSLHLPNHYILKVQEKIKLPETEDLFDIEYEIPFDKLDEFKGENVVIQRDNTELELNEDVYKVIEEILTKDYKITKPQNYINLLIEIIGDVQNAG